MLAYWNIPHYSVSDTSIGNASDTTENVGIGISSRLLESRCSRDGLQAPTIALCSVHNNTGRRAGFTLRFIPVYGDIKKRVWIKRLSSPWKSFLNQKQRRLTNAALKTITSLHMVKHTSNISNITMEAEQPHTYLYDGQIKLNGREWNGHFLHNSPTTHTKNTFSM